MTVKELRDALTDYLASTPEAADDPVVFTSPAVKADDIVSADYGYVGIVGKDGHAVLVLTSQTED